MTAIVTREHAGTTWLTGAVGVLLLAVAFMMMVVAAPTHGHHQPHVPLQSRVTTDLCHYPASVMSCTARSGEVVASALATSPSA